MTKGSARHEPIDLGKWRVEPLRSVLPTHLSGWLVNKATGNRYVFTVVGDSVRYMKEPPARPTNIPRALDASLIAIRNRLEGTAC